jgi:hypothetical protein
MRARWKLGRLLAAMERGTPFPGSATMVTALPRFWEWVSDKLGLAKPTALTAQRIGALPETKLGVDRYIFLQTELTEKP